MWSKIVNLFWSFLKRRAALCKSLLSKSVREIKEPPEDSRNNNKCNKGRDKCFVRASEHKDPNHMQKEIIKRATPKAVALTVETIFSLLVKQTQTARSEPTNSGSFADYSRKKHERI